MELCGTKQWFKRLLRMAAMGCGWCAILAAEPLQLCVHYDLKVDKQFRRLVESEVSRYQTWLSAKLVFGCDAAGTVHIALLDRAAESVLPDALGATREENGLVLPEIMVFRDRIRELLPLQMRMDGPEARAIARVVAHELGHYLSGARTHREDGVNDANLTAAHLLSPPPRAKRR